MKARIAFYFAAVVALVLFLAAAIPSHATQHRDPATTPDNMQKAAAASSTKPNASASGSEANSAKARSTSGKPKKQSSGSRRPSGKPGR